MRRLRAWSLPFLFLMMASVIARDHLIPSRALPPSLSTSVDAVTLGRAHATSVVASLSNAWLAAADALARGKTVEESRAVLRDSWDRARGETFADSVAPAFHLVLPEGYEPVDDAQRTRVVALWRDFARGLKEAR